MEEVPNKKNIKKFLKEMEKFLLGKNADKEKRTLIKERMKEVRENLSKDGIL